VDSILSVNAGGWSLGNECGTQWERFMDFADLQLGFNFDR
jgi:hypothetical protein